MPAYPCKLTGKPALLLAACSLFAAGCIAQAIEPGGFVMQESAGIDSPIAEVMVSDAAMAIMDLPGVTGIAASTCNRTDTSGAVITIDCIVIYVENLPIAKKLPTTLGDYPVVVAQGGPLGTGLR